MDFILPFTFFVIPFGYVLYEMYITPLKFKREIAVHESLLESFRYEQNKNFPDVNDEKYGSTTRWIVKNIIDYNKHDNKLRHYNNRREWLLFCRRNRVEDLSKLGIIMEEDVDIDEEDYTFFF